MVEDLHIPPLVDSDFKPVEIKPRPRDIEHKERLRKLKEVSDAKERKGYMGIPAQVSGW